MRLRIEKSSTKASGSDLLVIAVQKASLLKKGSGSNKKIVQQLNKFIGNNALKALTQQGFDAEHGQTALFSSGRNKESCPIIVVGIDLNENESTRAHLERFRSLGAIITQKARSLSSKHITVLLDNLWIGEDLSFEAFLEGLILSQYRFDRYKTNKKKNPSIEQATLITERTLSKNLISRIECICKNVMLARDLINIPANDLRPVHLAELCKKHARANKIKIEVFNQKALTKMGAGGILCVGQGSSEPPYLVKLHYKPGHGKAKKKVALVGKAVTYDSGGLNIKTSMETMKCDMSGGAAVLASLVTAAQLKLNVELVGYIPIAENMISGNSFRAGDIYTLLSGKTVEVLNTDAEGRLILADALTLAAREKPHCIIDLATLTGACAVALGNKYGGLFCNDQQVSEMLRSAGDTSGEPFWELPLAEEYRKLIYSDIADYKNLFKDAKAITAALFLEEFVDKLPWAHLDIAGPAFSASSEGTIRAGGVGFGVRTVVRFIEQVIEVAH